MNVLFAINDGYFEPARVMLTSLFENNKFEAHDIYLLYSELKSESIILLEKCVRQYGCSFHSIKVNAEMFKEMPLSHHFSIETYYRFLMQSAVPETVDRILWLDSDMVIKGSLKEFYYQDFDGKHVVVCQSINSNVAPLLKKMELSSDTVYFNAGTILFNLELIRKTIDSKVYFDYIRNNEDKITWLDQDVLNVIYCEKKKIDEYKKYNFQHFSGTEFDKEIRSYIDTQTCILHYIGAVKPWNFRYIGYTRKYYMKYARRYQTIWKKLEMDIMHFLYIIKTKIKKR